MLLKPPRTAQFPTTRVEASLRGWIEDQAARQGRTPSNLARLLLSRARLPDALDPAADARSLKSAVLPALVVDAEVFARYAMRAAELKVPISALVRHVLWEATANDEELLP